MKMNLDRAQTGFAKSLLAGISAVLLFSGCAGNRPISSQERTPSSGEIWDAWSSRYRSALSAATTGKTPAERAQALELLISVAVRAPNSQAQAIVVRDACILAAAEADSAVLTRLDCKAGALRGLLGAD